MAEPGAIFAHTEPNESSLTTSRVMAAYLAFEEGMKPRQHASATGSASLVASGGM